MYEAFAVDVLDSRDQLISKQEHSFQTESSRAEVEEVLQARAQQLHHHHVEVALGAAPLDLWDSDATLKKWQNLYGAIGLIMVKTIQSSFPPSPNFERVTVSFDKLNNTDLFLQIDGVTRPLCFGRVTHRRCKAGVLFVYFIHILQHHHQLFFDTEREYCWCQEDLTPINTLGGR